MELGIILSLLQNFESPTIRQAATKSGLKTQLADEINSIPVQRQILYIHLLVFVTAQLNLNSSWE